MDLAWVDELRTGDAEIDNDHKQLLARAARMVEALRRRDGRAEIAGALDWLEQYAGRHFEAEERLMRETAFPGIERALAEHASFLSSLKEIRAAATQRASYALAIALCDRVFTYVRGHMQRTDRAMVEHARAVRGVTTPRAARAR